MAWIACHLFVQGVETDDLCEALLEYVREPAPTGAAALVGDPPDITVTPALDGWVAISGLGPWRLDLPGAATAISGRCSARVISAELFGQAYRSRIGQYERGGARAIVRTPEHGWDDGEASYGGPMPLYQDVEQRAYTTLRTLGVPVPLIVLGTTPYGFAGAAQPLGEGFLIHPPRDAPRSQRAVILAPDYAGEDCPVISLGAQDELNAAQFEHRYVEGVPTDGAVDRLIAIEGALEQRMRRAAPGAPTNLTITYHGGVYQQELDLLLRARGRHVPPNVRGSTPPWWQFWRHFGTLGAPSRKG